MLYTRVMLRESYNKRDNPVHCHFALLLYILKFHLVLVLPARVFGEDHEALEDCGVRDVFLRCQLRAFARPESDGSLVGLEARDGARLACLPDDVDCLAYPYRYGCRFQRFVERDEEARVHGGYEVVEHPVILIEDDWVNKKNSSVRNTRESERE